MIKQINDLDKFISKQDTYLKTLAFEVFSSGKVL